MHRVHRRNGHHYVDAGPRQRRPIRKAMARTQRESSRLQKQFMVVRCSLHFARRSFNKCAPAMRSTGSSDAALGSSNETRQTVVILHGCASELHRSCSSHLAGTGSTKTRETAYPAASCTPDIMPARPYPGVHRPRHGAVGKSSGCIMMRRAVGRREGSAGIQAGRSVR